MTKSEIRMSNQAPNPKPQLGVQVSSLIRHSKLGIRIWPKLIGIVSLSAFLSGCTLQEWVGTDPSNLQLTDIVKIINTVIVFFGAFGVIVTAFIMIAGYQSLIAAGSDEATTRAKDTIKYSAFGMVLIVFSYAIVKLVFATIASGTDPFK